MAVSIGLILINRLLLTDKNEKAGPLFISWYQFLVAYVCIIFLSIFCQRIPFLNEFPPMKYEWKLFVKVLPVTVTYLIQVGLNNKCLEYVSVSGYQIVRSLTILCQVILSYLILHQTTSLKACLMCVGIIIGFIFGVGGDFEITFKGAGIGVLSSVFVALYSIVQKQTIDSFDGNQNMMIEYNTPAAIALITPLVWISGEFSILGESRTPRFWIMQTIGGLLGFVISISIAMSIKYTSPLTHNISGTVKACIQTILAFVLFPGTETMTLMKGIGTVLVIGFSALYAYIRQTEIKERVIQEQADKENIPPETPFLPVPEESESDGNEI